MDGDFIPLERVRFGNFYSQPAGTLVVPRYGREGDLAILGERDGDKFIILLSGSMKGKGFPLKESDSILNGQYYVDAEIEVDPYSLTHSFPRGALINKDGSYAVGYEAGMMDFEGYAFVRSSGVATETTQQLFAYERWRMVMRFDGRTVELYRSDAADSGE